MPVVKQKWKSVDIVGKITETMRNVAAGKLPSTEKFLTVTRPFAGVTGPLFETEESPEGMKKILHVVIGCERGLCGVVGANLPKLVLKDVRSMNKKGDCTSEVVVLGKKTTNKLRAGLKKQVTDGYIGMRTKLPTFTMCLDITNKLLLKDFDEMIVYYNVYRNSSSFVPTQIKIYNMETTQKIGDLQFPAYEIEGDDGTIMQNLYEFKVASVLYNTQAEQLASEMGSRLGAMDGATRTCKEKSKDYEKIYQSLRKTKITNELTILSVGAKLAGKK
jgi:ATP synthase F1 gamma subunit